MPTRAHILYRVQRSCPSQRDVRADAPSLMSRFAAALARMGGSVAELPPRRSIERFLLERFPDARAIVSDTPEVHDTQPMLESDAGRHMQQVDVEVVRAVFGVAESGSVCLTENDFGSLGARLSGEHLVVLLDPAAILPTLHDAYREGCFFDARSAVLVNGNSATPDIEGVLWRGAQGVRSLTVVPLAAPLQARAS